MKQSAYILKKSLSPIYHCLETKGAIIKLLTMHNESSSAVYVNCSLKIETTQFPIIPADTELPAGAILEQDTEYFVPYNTFVMARANVDDVVKAVLQVEPIT